VFGFGFFSYAVSKKQNFLEEVVSMIELCFREKIWYNFSYYRKI